jgi:hypothetical protein
MKRWLVLGVEIAALVLACVVVLSVAPPLLPFIARLLLLGLFIVLIWALFSPFESLGWWAGWSDKGAPQSPAAVEPSQVERPQVDQFVVYLGGIGSISGDFLYPEEIAFLDEVQQRVPSVAIVRDVFPYAMNNRGLTGQGFFAWLWRLCKKMGFQGKYLLKGLVIMRNLFQVAVSADRRYGPIYNYGAAEVIRKGLLRQGYRIGSGTPVSLIGYSGGGQIAVGAAAYLQPALAAPLQIISLGGVMSDDPGITKIKHLFHLYGTKDPVQAIGAFAYAGRWPLLPYSPWNQAKVEGKITLATVGPVGHLDPGGYFEVKSSVRAPNERVIEIVAGLLSQQTHVL